MDEYPDYANNKKKENYDIYENIVNLQEDKKKLSIPKIKKKYIQLRQDHPFIFNKVLKNDLTEEEFELLKKMLNVRSQTYNKEIESKDAVDLVATEIAKIFMPQILEKK